MLSGAGISFRLMISPPSGLQTNGINRKLMKLTKLPNSSTPQLLNLSTPQLLNQL